MAGCWSALICAGVLWPWRATSQWVLYQAAKSSSARRNSSMVSKWRTHKRFSLSVRMKRSATPLPSGWRTKDGEASMPRKAISLWKSSDIEFGPWSCRSMRPAATSLPMAPKCRRTPWRTGFQGLEAVGALVGVDADAFAVAVIDGDEDVRHALGQGDALGHIGAPQDVHGLGGDGAVVRPVRSLADPVRRQKVVLPHQPAHPSGRATDAGKAQTGPDLAVALAGETRRWPS